MLTQRRNGATREEARGSSYSLRRCVRIPSL